MNSEKEGIQHAGRLNGKWDVYVDVTLEGDLQAVHEKYTPILQKAMEAGLEQYSAVKEEYVKALRHACELRDRVWISPPYENVNK